MAVGVQIGEEDQVKWHCCDENRMSSRNTSAKFRIKLDKSKDAVL